MFFMNFKDFKTYVYGFLIFKMYIHNFSSDGYKVFILKYLADSVREALTFNDIKLIKIHLSHTFQIKQNCTSVRQIQKINRSY